MATPGTRSAGATTGHDHAHTHGRTPAQWFCLIAGAALVLAGLLGFLADASFDTGDGVDGGSLLGFEVNGWHNLVHILTGALLLAGAPKRATAKTVALVFGVSYLLVTLIGLVDGDDVLGLLPINAADNVLHIVLTLGAIGSALASKAAGDRRGEKF